MIPNVGTKKPLRPSKIILLKCAWELLRLLGCRLLHTKSWFHGSELPYLATSNSIAPTKWMNEKNGYKDKGKSFYISKHNHNVFVLIFCVFFIYVCRPLLSLYVILDSSINKKWITYSVCITLEITIKNILWYVKLITWGQKGTLNCDLKHLLYVSIV